MSVVCCVWLNGTLYQKKCLNTQIPVGLFDCYPWYRFGSSTTSL